MKIDKKIIFFATLTFIICFNFIPIAFAKTRQNYIIDFIYENQNNDETFGFTYQDTAYALEIIEHYNSYKVEDLFGVKYSVDKTLLEENIIDYIQQMFDDNVVNIYDLYYLLKSLNILADLNEAIEVDLHNTIYNYINQTYQDGGGFSPSNISTNVNMASTYFIFKIYHLIDEPIINETTHQNWILACKNTDGGYGGNQTLSSTLLTTYYAIELIDILGGTLVDALGTINYLDSFYVNDTSNLQNNGGYLPDSLAERALLSSTFICTQSIDLINSNYLHKDDTITWVLKLQNFQDGGFAENLGLYAQRKSSIKDTYYAFSILTTFKALDLLNKDIFMVEFNYVILIIVLSCVAGVIALLYIIYRRRKI